MLGSLNINFDLFASLTHTKIVSDIVMESFTRFLAVTSVLGFGFASALPGSGWFGTTRSTSTGEAPTVTVRNGTYEGVYSSTYKQDFFLGMPFAKAPVGDLRLRIGEGLDETWEGTRDAKAYYPHCVGYGVSTLSLVLYRCGVDG